MGQLYGHWCGILRVPSVAGLALAAASRGAGKWETFAAAKILLRKKNRNDKRNWRTPETKLL